MAPHSRRVLDAARSSLPSLSGLVTRVAPLRRSRARVRRGIGRALLVAPALAVAAAYLIRRGPWLGQLGPAGIAMYGAALLLSIAIWAGLSVAAARRAGASRWLARAALF